MFPALPDLAQLVTERELITLLGRSGSPTPRAQRAVCRRWIDRHGIPTFRVGQSRFHPRAAVLAALSANPPRGAPPRPEKMFGEARSALEAFRKTLESQLSDSSRTAPAREPPPTSR